VNRHPIWPVVLLGLLLGAVLMFLAESYRATHSVKKPLLPVAFDHADHNEIRCTDCHHEFIDGTIGGGCYACHKYSEDIAADMEKMFHDFCFGCHVETRHAGKNSGPMRECAGCHLP